MKSKSPDSASMLTHPPKRRKPRRAVIKNRATAIEIILAATPENATKKELQQTLEYIRRVVQIQRDRKTKLKK